MKKVYINEQLLWVVQAKSVLEANGIPCFLKNEYASSIAGKVPFNETWPELWIHEDADAEQAEQLLKQWQEDLKTTDKEPHFASWKCDQCGETNEGQFALCWSCGLVLEPTS